MITEIEKYIDLYYLLAFMGITYSMKGYINNIIEYVTKLRVKKHHAAVFIIGTLTAIPFWFVWGHDKSILFTTYCIGTALHSHIISYVIKSIRKSNG